MNDSITSFQKIVLILSVFILIGFSYNLSFKDECSRGCPAFSAFSNVDNKVAEVRLNTFTCSQLEYVYPRCNILNQDWCSKEDVLLEMILKGCEN